MVAKLRIPKKLIQTYHLPDLIPQHIRSNVKIYAYDYERKIFDDQDSLNIPHSQPFLDRLGYQIS